jgi:hypothetical protein
MERVRGRKIHPLALIVHRSLASASSTSNLTPFPARARPPATITGLSGG